MTDTLTHLEELLAKATKGPWEVEIDTRTEECRVTRAELSYVAGYNISGPGEEIVGCEGIIPGGNSEANATLIVEAINALPALIARQRELEGALKPFAEQADFYDTCEQHTNGCPDDALSGESPDLTVGDFRAARRALANGDKA